MIWEGSRFRILDETLLPEKVEYIVATSVADGVRAVKEMKTRAFGQVLTFLYTMALALKENRRDSESLSQRVSRVAEAFTQARPTFDFARFVGFFLEWLRELPPGEEPGRWIETRTQVLVAKILQARTQRARHAAELLPNPCRLLTHCNISGELIAIAQHCREMGKEIEIFATETRPYFQGSRLTAWEAVEAGFRVHVLSDSAAAQIMAAGKIDAVLVGADRSARNGDIINKVGTYPLAVCAKEYGIPFYAVVQEPGSLLRGDDAVIEERPVAELLTFHGRSLGPEGIQGHYPAFDITPASLISFLVGFDGALTPADFQRRHEAVPEPLPAGRKGEKKRFLLVYGLPSYDSYPSLAEALCASKADAILVPEMRPELWGLNAAAPELLRRKLPVTLIADNMMGIFFARGWIERVYLCYTELNEKGAVGACGALLAALLARAHGIPIELLPAGVAPGAPADSDVATFCGDRTLPLGAHPLRPEPDLVPQFYLSQIKDGGS